MAEHLILKQTAGGGGITSDTRMTASILKQDPVT